MIISNQKRMAAQILSKKEGRTVGIHRVWINPDYLDEVSTAVQKDDIRQLIEDGFSFNDVAVDISDNHWTPYEQQSR